MKPARTFIWAVLIIYLLASLGPYTPAAQSAPSAPPVPSEPPRAPGWAASAFQAGSPAGAAAVSAEGCPAGSTCVYLPQIRNGSSWTGVDPSDRAASVNFYHQVYLASEGISSGWTGNVGACVPGQTSQAFKDAVLLRVNYFRAMAGIPPLEQFKTAYNMIDQAAALMMSANNALSHQPPASWKCYTQSGYDGASTSNLYLGVYGPSAISGYMRDPGANNTAAGHRRWLLYPQSRQLGTGDIPPGSVYSAANAFRAWDEYLQSPRPVTRDEYVAWPPAAFVPYQVVYARWSFAYPGANMDTATVSITHNGASVPVKVYTPAYGYGENTLVWIVNNMSDGASWPRPSADDLYTVSVRHVMIDSQPQNFSYTVTIIDPK